MPSLQFSEDFVRYALRRWLPTLPLNFLQVQGFYITKLAHLLNAFCKSSIAFCINSIYALPFDCAVSGAGKVS